VTARPAPTGAPFNLFISDWEPAPGWLPDGVEAWAIGDVHGHLPHLEALLGAVGRLMEEQRPESRHLVMMGDYIDRGPANIATLERVADLDLPGVTVTRLVGNHEEFLASLLADPDAGEGFLDLWTSNGGLSTLADLGVTPRQVERLPAGSLIDQVRASAPESVRRALGRLVIGLPLGGYLFIHAGVHPRHPLNDAEHQRFTTIREPFLSGEGWIHEFAVVHGHSIAGPDVRKHRIAVDSGCYYTGILTCAHLRADQVRFISATREPNLDGLRKIRARRPLAAEHWRRLR
jgi:serine/threonine protein phosphatase 1